MRSHPSILALTILITGLLSLPVLAAVKTQDVKYTVDKSEYVGFLAYDDANAAKRPGILIAPEWVGLNDYSRGRAMQLAEMGYIAFVFDPYGGGKNAADVKQSAEWSGALKADRPELRKRITGALETFRKQDRVDVTKIAAIGYCFGGTTVLELARSGADVQGVVSFHGGLSSTLPAKAGELKAKVLVCHGAVDPFVPPAEVAGFEKEMQDAKADWQLISYGNAVHSFTNPAAKGQIPGAEYNKEADHRSWTAMSVFLSELFTKRLGWLEADRKVFADLSRYRRIVFVADGTLAMMQRQGTAHDEIRQAIWRLRPDQSFNVANVRARGSYTMAEAGRLITPSALRQYLASGFMNEAGMAEGEFDPVPAIRAAIEMNADVIYVVTAGNFGTEASDQSLLKAVKQFNANKQTVIHCIAVENKGATATATLTDLARENAGTFHHLTETTLP